MLPRGLLYFNKIMSDNISRYESFYNFLKILATLNKEVTMCDLYVNNVT